MEGLDQQGVTSFRGARGKLGIEASTWRELDQSFAAMFEDTSRSVLLQFSTAEEAIEPSEQLSSDQDSQSKDSDKQTS